MLLGLLALALPAVVTAQSLGDAAAREKAKREAEKKAGDKKVFTNDDLNEGKAGTPAAGASSESAPPEATRPESGDEAAARPSEEPDRRTQEESYVGALTAAQSRVAEVEGRIRELQGKLNPMSTTYVYGDLNVGGNKIAEEAQVKAELAQADADLTAARQAVVDATRALQEFRQGRHPSNPEQ
jgi:hypothetical protein